MIEATREPTHPTERLPPPAAQQPHALPTGKVVGVGLVSLLIFAIGSLWAVRILRDERGRMNPSGVSALPGELGQEEIGIVDQVPFGLNHWVDDYRAEQAKKLGLDRADQLQGYSWVDPKAGKIRIPVERAMDLVVEEQNR